MSDFSKSEKMVNVSGQSIGYVTAITRFDCNLCNEDNDIFFIKMTMIDNISNDEHDVIGY